MGCNGSKSKDIQQSRKRVENPQQQGYGAVGEASHQMGGSTQVSSKALQSPATTKKTTEKVSGSYTDEKIKEKQMFQNIINSAAKFCKHFFFIKTLHLNDTFRNFITIAQSPGMLDIHETLLNENGNSFVITFAVCDISFTKLINRESKYIELLQNQDLFGVPTPSTLSTNISDILSQSSIHVSDIEYMNNISNTIVNLTRGIKINDENIGKLVIPLPSFDEA